MSQPEEMIREFGFEFRFRMTTGVSGTVTVPSEEIREVHPFAAMVGILGDHPLRDEFLEILGMGQEDV